MSVLLNKKIGLFGLGVSGLSAFKLLNALNVFNETNPLIIINSGPKEIWGKDFLKNKNIICVEEENALTEMIDQLELVILSPGIPRDHFLLKNLMEKKIPIWGEIELAYQYLEQQNALSPIIGITGTNGKTTVTTFLGELISLKYSTFVGGNIGVPFCDYALSIFGGQKKVDYIILELSSFQLESTERFHLNIGLMLNIFQSHGERYAKVEDYLNSKILIAKNMNEAGLLIYPAENKIEFADIDKKFTKYNTRKIKIDLENPKTTFDLKLFKLPGIHNLMNLCFVVEVAKELKIPSEIIQKSINSFKGVKHRIQFIESKNREFKNIIFFNDAKSTNWDATLTAISAMKNYELPLYLILGGKLRGTGDSIIPFKKIILENVTKVYLIGESMNSIVEEADCSQFVKSQTLDASFKNFIKECQNKNAILLFSPAFPSFDQFKNYGERGEAFIKLINELP